MKEMEHRFEDEIELMDYLRVIWKWKWLIITGTLFGVLAASIYSFTRPVVKMYKVSALIEVDPWVKLDPLKEIRSMIENGMFNQRILDDLSQLQEVPRLDHLDFEVAIPKDLNMLDIAYKTPDMDRGKVVMNSLIEQLEQEYAQQARSEFDTKLDKISMHIARVESRKERIRLMEVRIDQMNKALQEAQSSSEQLSAENKSTLLNPDNRTGRATSFLEAAAMYEVIDYPLRLRDRISDLIFEKSIISEEIMSEILIINDLTVGVIPLKPEQAEEKNAGDYESLLELKSRIDSFRSSREQFAGIIIRQPPTASPIPVRNKAKLQVLLAGIAGFFVMLFLAFFLEYIQGYRSKLGS